MPSYSFLDLMHRANHGHTDLILTEETQQALNQNSQAPIVRQLTTLVPHANIKLLPTTPFTLVPAPGDNKALVFLSAAFEFRIATAYANVTDTKLRFAYIYNGFVVSQYVDYSYFETEGTLATFVGKNFYLEGTDPELTNETEPVTSWPFQVNTALTLGVDNSSNGPLTEGAEANALYVTVNYLVYSFDTHRFE